MTTPPTQGRLWLAGQLAAIPELAGANHYAAPVEVVTAPAVILAPASEWLKNATLSRTQLGLDVTLAVTWTGGNAEALEALESLVWPVLLAFPGARTVLAPSVTRYGQAELYAATLTIPVLVTDDESETP